MGELSTVLDTAKFVCEKIEKAIGVVFDPFGAKKEAVDQFITRIKDENLPPFVEAALISSPRKYIKEYTRQNNILKVAIEELDSRKEQSSVQVNLVCEEVDEEWLSRFFDSAKHISDEDIQLIWGHILANELSSPGSVPKRLIDILSYIEPKQAEIFTLLCKYSCLEGSNAIPFIDFNDSREYWTANGIQYSSLLDLQSLGLISYNVSNDNCMVYPVSNIPKDTTVKKTYTYFNHSVIIKTVKHSELTTEIKVNVGKVIFTDAGEALFKAINKEYDQKALDHIVGILEKQGFTVEIAPLEE